MSKPTALSQALDAAAAPRRSENDRIADEFVAYIDRWVRGPSASLDLLVEEILTDDFPRRYALVALAKQEHRKLWRAFYDETLEDLYEMACDEGLWEAAEAFKAAALARPRVDDGKIPPAVRKLVMDRDNHQCQWPGCGSKEDLTIDHKWIAWSDGGSSKDPAVLHVLCRSHNSSKGRRPWTGEEEAA
jgi:hypothetical protein